MKWLGAVGSYMDRFFGLNPGLQVSSQSAAAPVLVPVTPLFEGEDAEIIATIQEGLIRLTMCHGTFVYQELFRILDFIEQMLRIQLIVAIGK